MVFLAAVGGAEFFDEIFFGTVLIKPSPKSTQS
jgi:hypothetical protein